MSKLDEIIRLVNDLSDWEFQKMSRSGQEIIIELEKILGMPTSKENA